MKKQEMVIEGMSCNHCVQHVTEAVDQLDGVEKVKIKLKKARGTVKYDESKIQPEAIIEAVKEAGYTATFQ